MSNGSGNMQGKDTVVEQGGPWKMSKVITSPLLSRSRMPGGPLSLQESFDLLPKPMPARSSPPVTALGLFTAALRSEAVHGLTSGPATRGVGVGIGVAIGVNSGCSGLGAWGPALAVACRACSVASMACFSGGSPGGSPCGGPQAMAANSNTMKIVSTAGSRRREQSGRMSLGEATATI